MKLFILFFLGVMSQSVLAQKLVVRIENIKDNQGQIGVAVYNSAKDFMNKQFNGKFVEAKAGAVEVIFENLPSGDYALSVMHDSNKNGKIDTNLMGIPKEGYGFSNNAMGTFGPPSFEKAKFKLGAETVTVRMRY